MHRSKRRKHASEAHDPSKAAPQGTKSTEDHLDSDDEAPVEVCCAEPDLSQHCAHLLVVLSQPYAQHVVGLCTMACRLWMLQLRTVLCWAA